LLTHAIPERFIDEFSHDKALCKSTVTLLYYEVASYDFVNTGVREPGWRKDEVSCIKLSAVSLAQCFDTVGRRGI